MISAIQSTQNLYSYIAAQMRPQHVATAAAVGASSEVSISDAAREAAAADTVGTYTAGSSGIKLPDYVAALFNKDLPQEVWDEAQARLDATREQGGLGADGPMMLPLHPENQALMDSFRQEMASIRAVGWENTTPEQAGRLNQLMNLTMRLQMVGWAEPMTEADVQREFDISNAMARLSAKEPAPTATQPETGKDDPPAILDLEAIPAAWRQRWADAGLTMPEAVTLTPGRSMWLDLGNAAGIGDDELLATARSLAGDLRGHALTAALENFISGRYQALTGEHSTG